jgi:hypothetical protein
MGTRRARVVWLAATALICWTLSGCSGHHSSAASDRCSRAANPATASTPPLTFDHLSLSVPVGWYPVKVCFNTGVLDFPMGYLTSEAPTAQCDSIGCGLPVAHLGDNDAVIAVTYAGIDLAFGFHPNATIAGRPAQVTETNSHDGAADGERSRISALVRLRNDNALRIEGHFGAASDQTRATFQQMLRNASYPH